MDYWFVRGDALFMVLDVMDENKWGDHEQFIADACEANPDIRWKLVFSHYSPYNSYEEYMEKGQEMRPYFLKFADDYDIDAVLCGHNHCYMRSYFINGDGTWQDYESPAVMSANLKNTDVPENGHSRKRSARYASLLYE